MSLASQKLYYRRSGSTYSCNLYTSTSDFDKADYVAVRSGGATLYAPLGSTSDGRASYLRMYHNGSVQAVFNNAYYYAGSWTQFGAISQPYTPSNPSSSYSVSTNAFKLYSTGNATNVHIYFTINDSDYNGVNCQVYINGTTYTYYYQGTQTVSKYYNLGTGSNTIILYGQYFKPPDSNFTSYYSVGYYIP